MGEGALAEVLRTLHSVESLSTLHQSLQSEGAQRLYAAAVTDDSVEGIDAENLVNKQIRRIQKQSLLKHSAKIQLDIEATERNKDSGALTKLLTEKVQIEQQLQALGSV